MTVLAEGGSCTHQCEQQEKQSRNFKPEHMHHAANVAGCDVAGLVEGPHPAIFAGSGARYSQDRAALPAQVIGWQETPFRDARP